jgi:hypothetical protein
MGLPAEHALQFSSVTSTSAPPDSAAMMERRPNAEIGGAPDHIERGECDDHYRSFRGGHGAMIISHSRDRANAARRQLMILREQPEAMPA